MTISRTLKAGALAAGALVLLSVPAGVGQSAGRGDQSWSAARNLDLTSSAHPSEAAPATTDDAFDVTSTWRRTVRADTSALASATCDGCRGDSTTLQVLYLRHGKDVSVDNAAVAWSQCAGCGGSALSVQVVVLYGGGRQIDADNRALATNAACDGCDTAALAYQLVVASPDRSRMSADALADLRSWVANQSALLRHLPTATPRKRLAAAKARKAAQRAAVTLEGLVNGDLGSRTRELDVQRR
jgi:hypothetical protein